VGEHVVSTNERGNLGTDELGAAAVACARRGWHVPDSQGVAAAHAEAERVEFRRFWAAVLLALDVDTCESILAGRRVIAHNLDALVFRRALRGGALPRPDSFVEVTDVMLDAVAEAGSMPAASKR
jgi:hypothetical protein